MMAGHASPEALPGAGPSPSEERRADLSQSSSMIRREVQGRLAMPREGSRRRVARRAGPRCTTRWLTSPTGLTARALLELGALEDDGGRSLGGWLLSHLRELGRKGPAEQGSAKATGGSGARKGEGLLINGEILPALHHAARVTVSQGLPALPESLEVHA